METGGKVRGPGTTQGSQQAAKPPHLPKCQNGLQLDTTEDGPSTEVEGEIEEGPHTMRETSHPLPELPPEVIFEARFNVSNKINCDIYKTILASIGLDSPTMSQEVRGREGNSVGNQQLGGYFANTPIHNSATSLMALGQHVMTPKQR